MHSAERTGMMNIGNRKRKPEDEFIPLWEKKCTIENIECKNCAFYSESMQWCQKYESEWLDELQKGKKLRY